jgi:hypothetical protein
MICRLRDGLQEVVARNCNPGSSPDDSNNQNTISAPIVGPTEGLVNIHPENSEQCAQSKQATDINEQVGETFQPHPYRDSEENKLW